MTPNETIQFIDMQEMLGDTAITRVDYMVDHGRIYLHIGETRAMIFRRHNRTIGSICKLLQRMGFKREFTDSGLRWER